MPDINVKLKLSFGSGEEQVYAAQVQASQEVNQPEARLEPPYRVPRFTAAGEPELVQSANFAEFR